MALEIPLSATPYQSLSVDLGDNTLLIDISYVARFEFFRVDVYDTTNEKIELTLGRAANAYTDLLRHVDAGYGALYIFGDQPTLENLGVTSKLLWEPSNA